MAASTATAQGSHSLKGEWEWAVDAKSRDELPPAYRGERLRGTLEEGEAEHYFPDRRVSFSSREKKRSALTPRDNSNFQEAFS